MRPDELEHDIIEREKRTKRSLGLFAGLVLLTLVLWLMFVRFL
jgi:hypothetical protein